MKDLIIILLLLLIIYMCYINQEMFSNTDSNQITINSDVKTKIIIAVFNNEFGLGLGDYMRGLIYLYKNCIDCLIYADYSKHPISNFLENTYIKPDYSEFSDIKRIWSKEDVDNLSNDKLNFTHCNLEHGNDISNNIKEFLLKSFTMKPEFEKYFNDSFNNLNMGNNFVVLHLRVDDSYFDKLDIPDLSIVYNDIETKIIPQYGINVLVMSNSNACKNVLCEKYNFKQFKCKPVHTNDNSSLDDLRDTLVEFFTLSKSTKIFQYSHYHHSSGFSTRISEIYNIELEKTVFENKLHNG